MASAVRIQVISYLVEKIIGTKGENKGVEFQIPKAQCVVEVEGEQPKVGVLNLPKGHPPLVRGWYRPTFKLQIGFDGKVVGAIDTLIPEKA